MWIKGEVFNLPEAAFFFRLFFFFCLRQPRTFDTVCLLHHSSLMSVLSWVEGCLHRSLQLPWYLKSYMDFFFFSSWTTVSHLSSPARWSFLFLSHLPDFPFLFFSLFDSQHFTLIPREIFWVGIYSVEVRCFSFFTSISSGFNLLGYSTTFVILYVGNL